MSYLQKQMNVLKFDKRLLEMNYKNGNLTEEEYKQHLSTLKDDVANSESIEISNDNDSPDSLNGGHHPVEAPKESPAMPTNNDPFGSGF